MPRALHAIPTNPDFTANDICSWHRHVCLSQRRPNFRLRLFNSFGASARLQRARGCLGRNPLPLRRRPLSPRRRRTHSNCWRLCGLPPREVSGNSAHVGGGASELNNAKFYILDSTVSNNDAVTTGGGVDANQSILTLGNTILSGNSVSNPATGFPDAAIVNSSDFTASNSLLGTTAIPDSNQNNISSDTPGLSPLADNGGPTQTMALASTSPAINAGDNTKIPSGVVDDQRGAGHPRIVNGTVDIGAIEYFADTIFANGFDTGP